MNSNSKSNSAEISTFFHDYAGKFDSIYGDGQPRSVFDRLMDKMFRQAMFGRYKKTLAFLQKIEPCTILDVGSGSGRYAKDALDMGFSVTGIDLAPDMIAMSKDVCKGSDKCNFILGDYMNVDLEKRHDVAILMGLFDYVEDPESMFKKLVTDIDGYILASFPKTGGFLAAQRKYRYTRRNCPLYYYSRQKLENVLSAAGVHSYEVEDNDREFFLKADLRKL